MRIAEARALSKEWQEILGLQHWQITVRWANKSDRVEDCYGCAEWFTEEASATIILNRKRADEATVIHEQIHILFQGHLPQPENYDALFEQSINRLAALLLKWKQQ